jgi:hypothetical protein
MTAVRAAVAALVTLLLAGGLIAAARAVLRDGSDPQPATAPIAPSRIVTGEIRSPDARSPLKRAEGLWLCHTAGVVELRVSEEGLATLSLDGSLLASAFNGRTLINRDCDAAQRSRRELPPFHARRALPGNGHLRCPVPHDVLVDLRDSDLTVRRPRSGSFLLGAAVTERYLEPAAYWSTVCLIR